MGLLDKAKKMAAEAKKNSEGWSQDISKTISTSLIPLVEKAKDHIKEDIAYLKFVATPLFKMLPLPIQMIGRERLKWDAILLDTRNEVILPSGGSLKANAETANQIADIVKRHHSNQ